MSGEESKIALLFKEIHTGNKAAFDQIFVHYYPKLLAFAHQYVKQVEVAEEITSELFVKLWLKRESLVHILNPEVYLFISIKNACLNVIRADRKRKEVFAKTDVNFQWEEVQYQTFAEEDKELQRLLDSAVAELPEQRRIIFKSIKEQGLKPEVVAKVLGISKRTVENQLYKAVKTLAESISDYLGYHPQKKITKKQALTELPILFFF